MDSTLLDPTSDDTKPVFLRTVCNDIAKLPELARVKHRVLKIRLFKEKTLVGHEFLILDVFDNKTLIRLLVERRPSRRKAEKQRWSITKPDLLVSDGDDIVKRVPVTFSPKPYHLLITLSADADEAPTFADVCRIFGDVLRDAPDYTLFRRQCYWFTGTAIEVLKSEYAQNSGKGEYNMHARDGPQAVLLGRTARLPIYPECKAQKYVEAQIKREDDERRKNDEKIRKQMQEAMNNAITMVQEEHRVSKETMRRAVQPLLIAPEAYRRNFWTDVMRNVEEDHRKSKEDLQRVIQSLQVVEHDTDAGYWK